LGSRRLTPTYRLSRATGIAEWVVIIDRGAARRARMTMSDNHVFDGGGFVGC
jgi:hypothetical protein